MKIKKKILNTLIISFTTIVLALIVFEISYRFQIFDFYKAELKGLNSKEELKSEKPKILVCGDSFSASPDSYVKVIKDSLKEYSVINASVPGSGIVQHAIYMPGRIKKFKPEIFVYQFYIGNDLFDISHPISSSKLSFSRKVYWWITDRLISLSFLNFRFAGVKYNYYDDAKVNDGPKEKELFSIANYSNREKLNYKAETGLLENTLYLLNGREKDLLRFEKKFKSMINFLDPSTRKVFIVIPHQAQVSEYYFNSHNQLGADFKNRIYSADSKSYPIYLRLAKLCDELGFEFVDPLDQFRLIDATQQLYYSNDPHLNNSGSFVLGIMLANRLKQFSNN